MTTPSPTLSAKDTHILSLLSLPSVSPTPTTSPINLTPNPTTLSTTPPTPASKESLILTPLNTSSPTPLVIAHAISSLTTLINEHPSYASAYNNRAQASRMLHGDDLRDGGVYEAGIWADLGMAIGIAGGEAMGEEGGEGVKEGKGREEREAEGKEDGMKRVLAAAYTQRAWMVYKLSKSEFSTPSPRAASQTTTTTSTAPAQPNHPETNNAQAPLPRELQSLDTAALESWAAHDFEMGARYGNEVAREMAKATNPYARLCGAIVGEVMRREMGDGM